METVTFKSHDARVKWRDMMDAALVGKQVVIERYDTPQAVLVNYAKWQRDQIRLRQLELEAEARRLREKLATGEMGRISGGELITILAERYGHEAVAALVD